MSYHPFGPIPSQKSAPLPGHSAAANDHLTVSSTSSSSLTGAPWVQRAGRPQPLPATHPAAQPLTGREVHHVGAPRSTGSSSSSSSSSLSLAPQDESAWADLPPLEPLDPAPARTECKSEERPAPVQRRAAARVKREPAVKPEPEPVPLSSTSAGTRAPKRKAEDASIEGSQAPGPGRKAETRPLPSSSRLAQAGGTPETTASSSAGASWQERLSALLEEGTGEDDAVSLPSDPAAWGQALLQVLPELTRALELTRPKFVDAAPTEAERLALDLAHHLGELLAQLPGPLATARAQALKAQAQDALQRLGRAAALPNGALADVPALQRAAGAGEGEEALGHQPEVLALRLGGAGMRTERRDLVLARWMAAAVAGGSPQVLCARVQAFARVASRLAAQSPQATQWLADALHAATRQVLMQAGPPDAATASLDALGEAFAPLLARDAEAVVKAMAPLVEAAGDRVRSVADGTYCVMRGLAGNRDAIAIAKALLQHSIARFTGAEGRPLDSAAWFASMSGGLLAGSREAVSEASADLLQRVSDAYGAQGRRLAPTTTAHCLAAMICDSTDPQHLRAHKVLAGLARLPLERVAELLELLCKHQPLAAKTLRAALCNERTWLTDAQAAHVALAFGLARRAFGPAAVQALFPATAQGNARYALCRQACLAALRPIEVLRLALRTTQENLALLREALRLAPSGNADFSACAGLRVVAGAEHADRFYRLAAYAELFEAGHAGSAFEHLMAAHRTVLVDLQCLLAPLAPESTREAALQCATRFYGTLARCHASVGLGAGVPSAAAREQATLVLDLLDEMLRDLRRQDAELQAVAIPLVEREADRLRALLAT